MKAFAAKMGANTWPRKKLRPKRHFRDRHGPDAGVIDVPGVIAGGRPRRGGVRSLAGAATVSWELVGEGEPSDEGLIRRTAPRSQEIKDLDRGGPSSPGRNGQRQLTAQPSAARMQKTPTPRKQRRGSGLRKWAWVELNHRPHAYQACALTT
jgi:hypothetical protein